MIKILQGLLVVLTLYFASVFFHDYAKSVKAKKTDNSKFLIFGGIGFLVNFLDTLGIGSFAIFTSILKNFKLTEDRVIPGTLNVACTIPIVVEAFVFITVIKVEPVTLISMIVAATIGAIFGAGIVSKLDEKKIQVGMGIALVLVAGIMLAGQLNIMPLGGKAIGLTGTKLVIAVSGNFILGALMTLGIGLYAPCMALVYALGMSPRVAFPIMMASCAFLMPAASARFVKEDAYDKKIPLPVIIFGSVGVLIAAYIVKELPLNLLKWMVIVVITYTSVIMFKSSLKKVQNKVEDNLEDSLAE